MSRMTPTRRRGIRLTAAHDPARVGEREAHLVEMRRRQPRVGRPTIEEAAA